MSRARLRRACAGFRCSFVPHSFRIVQVADTQFALLATELIYKQAKALEVHVHESHDTAAYRVKIRSLFQNLKDKSNPSLRENVVSGEISAARLCNMTPAVRFV